MCLKEAPKHKLDLPPWWKSGSLCRFQPQLGRVALLRDMIDWCIENPVRGEHLDPNGPGMRALEAYIMAEQGRSHELREALIVSDQAESRI